MPEIGAMSYGYDAAGLQEFMAAIYDTALSEAKSTVVNIESIKKVCDDEWEGQAKENFKNNLQSDANHVSEQYEALYIILQEEVNQVLAAMQEKDKTLIEN